MAERNAEKEKKKKQRAENADKVLLRYFKSKGDVSEILPSDICSALVNEKSNHHVCKAAIEFYCQKDRLSDLEKTDQWDTHVLELLRSIAEAPIVRMACHQACNIGIVRLQRISIVDDGVMLLRNGFVVHFLEPACSPRLDGDTPS